MSVYEMATLCCQTSFMDDQHKQELDDREDWDGLRVCRAFASVMQERDMSSKALSDLTAVPEANIRRMTQGQEPKSSTIARFERAMGVPVGTVLRKAGLIEISGSVEDLLATDPELHPVLRRNAVETYRTQKKLSIDLRTD